MNDYAEMARKTVVRRICKYLPLSIELAEAISIDESSEVVDAPSVVGEVIGSTIGRAVGVKAKLAAKIGRPATQAEERAPEAGDKEESP